MGPIEKVVSSLKKEAMDRAEGKAHILIDNIRHELEAVDFDLDKVAPRPHGRMSRVDYFKANTNSNSSSRLF